MPIWHVSLDTYCLPRATLLQGGRQKQRAGLHLSYNATLELKPETETERGLDTCMSITDDDVLPRRAEIFPSH